MWRGSHDGTNSLSWGWYSLIDGGIGSDGFCRRSVLRNARTFHPSLSGWGSDEQFASFLSDHLDFGAGGERCSPDLSAIVHERDFGGRGERSGSVGWLGEREREGGEQGCEDQPSGWEEGGQSSGWEEGCVFGMGFHGWYSGANLAVGKTGVLVDLY